MTDQQGNPHPISEKFSKVKQKISSDSYQLLYYFIIVHDESKEAPMMDEEQCRKVLAARSLIYDYSLTKSPYVKFLINKIVAPNSGRMLEFIKQHKNLFEAETDDSSFELLVKQNTSFS